MRVLRHDDIRSSTTSDVNEDETPDSTRALLRVRSATDSNSSSLSVVPDETFKQQDREDLDTSDSPEYLAKEAYVLENGILVEVTATARLPTNAGYFTDVFLGGAAFDQNASSQLRELCLSAQNARMKNEVPRQPTKDHWNFLLEEAGTLREYMREQRNYFFEVAKEASRYANWGWEQREDRRRGDVEAWGLFRRRIARAEHWTAQEVEEDARELATLAFAQHIKRKKLRAF